MRIEKAIKRYLKNGYKMANGNRIKKEMGLGDLVELVIRKITFGYGKKMAKSIASLFGYTRLWM